jgi:hypothetical protein
MSIQLRSHFCLKWRKSSFSADQGNCVEVATRHSDVLVRDSNNRHGSVLAVTTNHWVQFLADIQK